nr:MAG TPA: hypothetical protein [Caudoviricetes sp.]
MFTNKYLCWIWRYNTGTSTKGEPSCRKFIAYTLRYARLKARHK